MENLQASEYDLIAKAIDYIGVHPESVTRMDDIAEALDLSLAQFQKLIADWAKTSPKKFFANISHEKIKNTLIKSAENLFDSDFEDSFVGSGRLHDHFIEIEVMSTHDTKNSCENLKISFSLADSHYGTALLASTHKGLCYLGFADDEDAAMQDLRKFFPKAEYNNHVQSIHQDAIAALTPGANLTKKILLHLKGTKFQILVWEALLKIPMGALASYSEIAKHIRHPKANRAVGTAVGFNPVSFLVPCHRVIPSTGHIGKYMWGSTRKAAMIACELDIAN